MNDVKLQIILTLNDVVINSFKFCILVIIIRYTWFLESTFKISNWIMKKVEKQQNWIWNEKLFNIFYFRERDWKGKLTKLEK